MLRLLVVCFFTLPLWGETLRFDDLQTTLLSKNGRFPVPVTLSLAIEGRDMTESKTRLLDTIQTVLGSFRAEELATGEGRERLKKRIKASAEARYDIGIDYVYIERIRIDPDSLLRCREVLRRLCGDAPASR